MKRIILFFTVLILALTSCTSVEKQADSDKPKATEQEQNLQSESAADKKTPEFKSTASFLK